MIQIADRPFAASEIMGEYPENSIERQVLNKMSESTETYRYDSLSQLKFELRVRKETVNAARDLHKSRISFADFNRSRRNPAYWDRTENGGFRLKEGVKPSEAINDIFVHGNQYATECATAMMIVYYRALQKVFPEDLFNSRFSKIYLMNWHSLDPLLREIGIPIKTDTLLPGDRGYFPNPDVDPKTPEWQGENVIVLPDSLYYGHGIGITTAGKIIDALNAKRKKDATQSAYKLDAASRPNYKKLADIYDSFAPQPAYQGLRAYPSAI